MSISIDKILATQSNDLYEAYYCEDDLKRVSPFKAGMMFGGAYREDSGNSMFGGKAACPGTEFITMEIGDTSNRLIICYSTEHLKEYFQRKYPFIFFYGYYGCRGPQECQKKGAVKYITGDGRKPDDCEYYCVIPGEIRNYEAPELVLPPFDN